MPTLEEGYKAVPAKANQDALAPQVIVEAPAASTKEPKVFISGKNNSCLQVLYDTPITNFAVPLGLSSQTLLLSAIEQNWAKELVGVYFLLASSVFAVVSITYLVKVIFNRKAFKNDINDPVRVNFLHAPVLVILFLTLGCPKDWRSEYAELTLFWVLVSFVGFTDLRLYSRWLMSDKYRLVDAKLPRLMATVGWFVLSSLATRNNIRVLGRLCFAVGFSMWSLVYITIWQNLYKTPKITRKSPLLFLLVAPPSAAALAWSAMNGMDQFAEGLIFYSTFLYVMVLRMVIYFIYLDFDVSNWAYTFPMSAFAVAFHNLALHYEKEYPDSGSQVLLVFSWIFISLGGAVALLVLLQTIGWLFGAEILHKVSVGQLPIRSMLMIKKNMNQELEEKGRIEIKKLEDGSEVRCFLGDAFITTMVESEAIPDCDNREEGLRVGRQLREKGVLEHWKKNAIFHDRRFYYVWKDEQPLLDALQKEEVEMTQKKSN